MNGHPKHTNYERMVAEYSPGLKAFLSRRLGNESDAEDTLQEILYNLFRNAGDDLAGITNLPAWLYRAARNLLANMARRSDLVLVEEDDFLLEQLCYASDNQESDLLHNMFWKELETALSELPDEQRQVWEMTELEGVSVQEIAEITGIKQATLLSRKHYAVKHLREKLRPIYNDILNM